MRCAARVGEGCGTARRRRRALFSRVPQQLQHRLDGDRLACQQPQQMRADPRRRWEAAAQTRQYAHQRNHCGGCGHARGVAEGEHVGGATRRPQPRCVPSYGLTKPLRWRVMRAEKPSALRPRFSNASRSTPQKVSKYHCADAKSAAGRSAREVLAALRAGARARLVGAHAAACAPCLLGAASWQPAGAEPPPEALQAKELRVGQVAHHLRTRRKRRV